MNIKLERFVTGHFCTIQTVNATIYKSPAVLCMCKSDLLAVQVSLLTCVYHRFSRNIFEVTISKKTLSVQRGDLSRLSARSQFDTTAFN